MASNLLAQEVPIDLVPHSEETIKLVSHPVKSDPDLGVSTARLGEGSLYQTDLTLVEIPPGGQLPLARHLAEEMIYIVAGEGYTTMWTRPGEKPQRYEWTTGDMVSPSLNAWHQHFNSSADTPARYVSLTTTPLTNNLFHDPEFLTSSEFVFEERWQQGITQQAQHKTPDLSEGSNNVDLWAGHVLYDLPGREMNQRRENVFGINTRPTGDMAGNYILELSTREYHDQQRHPSQYPRETIIYILAGEGSTILQRGDEPARRLDWEAGDLFIVEANEQFDNGARIGSVPKSPYPRILMLKPAGYFIGVGNIVPGSSQYSY
jgi:quercetin dioxygenase-like cupin family protein